MAGIPNHIIEEIKQRADIVEVVSDALPLKKAGVNYRALCPFHEEKTPSFNVNPEKQIFHCFGCGEGGNAFSFVMKWENVSFPDAVRSLAARYGVAIPSDDGGKQNSQFDRLYSVMEAATSFYHNRLLKEPAGSQIRRYMEKRGLTDATIQAFRLGFAPDAWDELTNHLKDKGYDSATLEKAGLIKKSSRGNFIDRFRARVMFPISDPGGKVIAFGGRRLDDKNKETAKYINSPETPVYHKSRVLYGYDLARKAARNEGAMIVVEGYTDVIALREAGVENCCACSGTAFTPAQAELIKRLCDKVILLFDSDKAGIAAAKRSGSILLDHELGVKVLTLKGYKDPDEYLSSHGQKEFLELAGKASSFVAFVIDQAVLGNDLSNIEGRVAAARETTPYIRRIKDAMERHYYMEILAEKTRIDVKALGNEVDKAGGGVSGDLNKRKSDKPKTSLMAKAERILIGILLEHPDYLKSVAKELCADDFSDPLYKEVFKLTQESVEAGAATAAEVVGRAENDDLRNSVTSICMEKSLFDEEVAEEAAKDCVIRLKFSKEEGKRKKDLWKTAGAEEAKEEFPGAQKKYFDFREKRIQ